MEKGNDRIIFVNRNYRKPVGTIYGNPLETSSRCTKKMFKLLN